MGKIIKFYRKNTRNSLIVLFVWSFVLNMVIETLARKGAGGFIFLAHSPLVFLFNSLLIFATLSVSILFRRQVFFIVIISCLWGTVGVVNGIILIERMTPFTVKDLSALTDAATIMTNYFSFIQLLLMAVGIVLAVFGVVMLWLKSPKRENYQGIKKRIIAVLLVIVCTTGTSAVLIKTDVLATFFGNLAYAYRDYGVPYCFTNTWLNTGIQKPAGYSEDQVRKALPKDILDKDGNVVLKSEKVDQQHPNILFLQLESFVDPDKFNNIKLSRDAMPFYRQLEKDYSSGSLQVPACGAGTANTEFEVMTGLSVRFFGPGEYPFKSVLKDRTAESIARDLKSMGYGTHAIHNHRALFYNRNQVFDNIGYDTFTSVEYMSDVAKTPKNWAKDRILTSQIMDAMKSTDSRDYIYTISVQGHGKYPTEQLIKNPAIVVTDAPSEDLKWKYEYYVNQVYEMDRFVKNLTETLQNFDEPTVLVMYGDHIPALDIREDTYDAKDLYQTQYVIWSNFPMPVQHKDMKAYELASDVLDRLDIHKGTIMRYQQETDHSSRDYMKNLKLLGYDMLYGQDYIYGGKNPFKKAGMKMGVKTVKIDKVVNIGGKYYIKGENFTEYSKVTLDGETLNTIYLAPNLLGLLEDVNPEDAKKMKVSQIDKSNKEIISTTE